MVTLNTAFVVSAFSLSILTAGAAVADCPVGPDPCDTAAAPMVRTYAGYSADPLFTVGESIKGYLPPGIPDGIAAFRKDSSTARILVNHHLGKQQGAIYQLANATQLTGARVSAFEVRAADRKLTAAGLAFGVVFDRTGAEVTSAAQINEIGDPLAGFDQLSSSAGYEAGMFGFANAIAFISEEASEAAGHPHGGSVWAIDVGQGQVWALPALGRGSWANVTALTPPAAGGVALAMSDGYGGYSRHASGSTHAGAPLYFYLGTKAPATFSSSFPERNGLSNGRVYYFKAAAACDAPPLRSSPADFSGTGSVMTGVICPIDVRDEASAGTPGYDAAGWLNAETLRATALSEGAFAFSRPGDVSTDPKQPHRFAFTSTGRGSIFPADDWGDLYVVTTSFATMTASVQIVYDGDDSGGGRVSHPDFGLRSPDNVLWGQGGLIFVNEDPATELNVFGAVSRKRPGIWRVNPQKTSLIHVAAVDTKIVYPTDATNIAALRWETAGMIDMARALGTRNVFLTSVQAHGIKNGSIASANLVEGGQLLFLIY